MLLDRHTFEFTCPGCSFHNRASLGQVRTRDVVICRGCKVNLRLDDYKGTVLQAERRIQAALRGLFR